MNLRNEFFGLKSSPFNMTPDPSLLFFTTQHREALAGLTYAILDRKGFVVLTGDAGTGKTTLLARVLKHLPASQIQSSVILNPVLTPAEFLEMALFDFGVEDIPTSKAQRLILLQRLLLNWHREGKIAALVVDEAHKLSTELLEEIRLLGNFEHDNQKLLQVLLVGQNELCAVLNRVELRQFKQRIAFRLSISPLSAPEVEQYLRYRWRAAGGAAFPFTPEAVEGIAKWSKGFPRLINSICDNAMMLAFGKGALALHLEYIAQAAGDLELIGMPDAPAEPVLAACEAPKRERAAESAAAPVKAAAAAAAAYDDLPIMHTLERYDASARPSLFTRFAMRLGLAR